MLKIAIIGPYPPPYGGISVHIQRTLSRLVVFNIPFHFFNESPNSNYLGKSYKFYGKYNKVKSLLCLLFGRYKIIHHHSPDSNVRIALCFLGALGKNVFLHIHGASLGDDLRDNNYKKFFFSKMFKYVNVLADNPTIENQAKALNAKTVTLIDAFLPPVYKESLLNRFRESLLKENYLNQFDFIISMTGWFTYYNEEDLYGFDLALKALEQLSSKYNVLFVASVNGIVSESLHTSFLRKLNSSGLMENFKLLYENLEEIWPLYIISDVFIRPTNTDGSALSIKEALWFETPVIASDCIERPDNVILFTDRDPKSLATTIEEVILRNAQLRNPNKKIEAVQRKKFRNRIFGEIYGIKQ